MDPQGFVEAYKTILATGSANDHPSPPFTTILAHLAIPLPWPEQQSKQENT